MRAGEAAGWAVARSPRQQLSLGGRQEMLRAGRRCDVFLGQARGRRLVHTLLMTLLMTAGMDVFFRRTGQHRYAIRVERPGLPVLVMDPAPGYDPLMPHDLTHMIVEAALGLQGGVFGQLAAGGDAGTFHPAPESGGSSRQELRQRRRLVARGKKLAQANREDGELSEQASYVCLSEWHVRSASPERRRIGRAMLDQARQVRAAAGAGKGRRALDARAIDRICRLLDDLSARWSRLRVGESLAVRWPDLASTTHQAA